jgi:hypothetical protein
MRAFGVFLAWSMTIFAVASATDGQPSSVQSSDVQNTPKKRLKNTPEKRLKTTAEYEKVCRQLLCSTDRESIRQKHSNWLEKLSAEKKEKRKMQVKAAGQRHFEKKVKEMHELLGDKPDLTDDQRSVMDYSQALPHHQDRVGAGMQLHDRLHRIWKADRGGIHDRVTTYEKCENTRQYKVAKKHMSERDSMKVADHVWKLKTGASYPRSMEELQLRQSHLLPHIAQGAAGYPALTGSNHQGVPDLLNMEWNDICSISTANSACSSRWKSHDPGARKKRRVYGTSRFDNPSHTEEGR